METDVAQAVARMVAGSDELLDPEGYGNRSHANLYASSADSSDELLDPEGYGN